MNPYCLKPLKNNNNVDKNRYLNKNCMQITSWRLNNLLSTKTFFRIKQIYPSKANELFFVVRSRVSELKRFVFTNIISQRLLSLPQFALDFTVLTNNDDQFPFALNTYFAFVLSSMFWCKCQNYLCLLSRLALWGSQVIHTLIILSTSFVWLCSEFQN